MSQNLTDNPSTFVVQTAVSAGDARTASSVIAPMQAAANRTAFLKAHVDALEANHRVFDSASALKASTGYVANSIAYVHSLGPFYFDPAATGSDVDLSVYRPDNILLASPGRWVRLHSSNYATLVGVGSGRIVNSIDLLGTPTLCNPSSNNLDITASSQRNVGTNLRLKLQFYAEFEAKYTGLAAPNESAQYISFEIQKTSAPIINSQSFHVPGVSQYQNGIEVTRCASGFIETMLNGGNGVYAVRFYASRYDAGGVLVYSRFKNWSWSYEITEVVL